MKYRLSIAALLLLAVALHAAAQALTDRYNRKRPVVVVCDGDNPPYSFLDADDKPSGYYVDVITALTRHLGVPCKIVMEEWTKDQKKFRSGNADMIFDAPGKYADGGYSVSDIIVNYTYSHANGDSVAEIHLVGKDRQLIEQMDDQYMRMTENGDIAVIRDQWLHPERAATDDRPVMFYITVAMLALVVILSLLAVLIRLHISRATRKCKEDGELITQIRQLGHFYATEDNKAAHDLRHRYETILGNPFLAISFYDNNGKLVVQNEAMKQLNDDSLASRRQPLYNAKGEIVNYFVAVRCPRAT